MEIRKCALSDSIMIIAAHGESWWRRDRTYAGASNKRCDDVKRLIDRVFQRRVRCTEPKHNYHSVFGLTRRRLTLVVLVPRASSNRRLVYLADERSYTHSRIRALHPFGVYQSINLLRTWSRRMRILAMSSRVCRYGASAVR
jgi:hypothetical protein